MNRVTEQSFYKYLKCPSWLGRELETGHVRDALLEKIQDDGLLREHELALIKKRPYVEVEMDDVDEAAQKTLEFMRRGEQTIYQGVLLHGRWVARPELLERVEGKSKLGAWYYVACDIKRSTHLKDEYQFQGCFYAELLELLQGTRPQQSYVMYADGNVEGFLIDEFYTRYKLTLDAIEQILDGSSEQHFLTSGCKQGPFFSECVEGTSACGDLSLINRIWRSEVDALHSSSIHSVADLAKASPRQLAGIHDMTKGRAQFLHEQAVALTENKVIRLGNVDLPSKTHGLVLDIESDPLRNSDYLFGVLLVDESGDSFHSFLAKKPEDEGEAWKSFIEFLGEHPDLPIYHYGWYETDVFRRLVDKYGAPDKVVQQFEDNAVDVMTRMREKVIFPMPFYSLKDIAKYLGYKWKIGDASGLDSVLWYEDWLATGNEEAVQDIIDYNEDDVRATWKLIQWA